jgi:hypothetical protein
VVHQNESQIMYVVQGVVESVYFHCQDRDGVMTQVLHMQICYKDMRGLNQFRIASGEGIITVKTSVLLFSP